MIFLLAAIVCTSAIALLFKVSESRGLNRYALTAANYATAVLVSAGSLLGLGGTIGDPHDHPPSVIGSPSHAAQTQDDRAATTDPASAVAQEPSSDATHGHHDAATPADIWAEIQRAAFAPASAHELPVVSAAARLTWATLIGLVAGVLFVLGFLYYHHSVREHGAGLAGAFIKLGVLVPMSLSMVVWQEWPSLWQAVGIALALLSLGLVYAPALLQGFRRAQQQPSATPSTAARGSAVLLLFLFGGMAEFSNKVYEKVGLVGVGTTLDQLRGSLTFLLVTFSVALLLSLALAWRRRQPVSSRDLLFGALLGLPNLFASTFLILSLDTIPAAVAFPAFAAGSIVVVNLVSTTVFGERLRLREWAAIGFTIAALVLLNLAT